MNKLKRIKGKVLPFAVVLSAWWFVPATGLLAAHASVQNVQQEESISGTVVDNTGEAVIGASVIVVGAKTTTGTVTDFDGNFTLKVKPGTQLKITFVGYKEKVVKASSGMKVILEEESTMLQGVEVVAYGVQKKVTVTGALSSVKAEDLTRTPVSSVNNVLAGQLSGVTTVQTSGEPGSDAAQIFVRGQGTWADSSPLIQVDGVERDMWDIDPNEIESVTVLKDASATAVFGVRGANGVILITTKRGSEGKAKISFNVSFSALTPTKMVEQTSSYEYATFHNAMRANDGKEPYFTQSVLDMFESGADPVRFPSMKWTDYLMKDVTLQQQHNVNISGGNKTVKYFISAGMFTQDGIFEEFDRPYDYGYQYQRFNYRTNLDIDVTKTTKVSFNISGKIDESCKPHTGQSSDQMIREMYWASPFSSAGFVDGKYIVTSTSDADNYVDDVLKPQGETAGVLPFGTSTPMAYAMSQPGAYHYNNNKLQMDLVLDQKLDFITKGLSLKLKGSYNSSYRVRKEITHSAATYTPVYHKYALTDENGEYIQTGTTVVKDKNGNDETVPVYAWGERTDLRLSGDNTDPVYSNVSDAKGRNWYAEGSLNYNRSFGLHTITALALYNQSKEYYISGDYSDIPRTYVGFVGRITYDWNNRYMAEFNFGYNGSENFAPGKRFGSFPAGSVGWVMSDEPFFKPLKRYVSFLKLRASWGLVGNDKIGGSRRFMYMADPYIVNQTNTFDRFTYTSVNEPAFAYLFGIENGTATKGAYESAKNNPEVSWEKAFKQDYGIDVNFLDDRLRLVFDYYKEHRTDILARDMTVPGFLGFDPPYTNFGIVDSHGWELSVNWQDKVGKDFRYNVKLNLSHNQNEIIEDREKPQENDYMYTAGHRIGSRLQYKFWKLYYEGAEADYEKEFGSAYPTQLKTLKPGDPIFVDLDKNGIIDANDQSRDYGYTDDPQYIAGLNLAAYYKDFSFSAQFTGAWAVSRVLGDVFRRPFQNRSTVLDGGLLRYHLENTWTVDNPDPNAEYPRATWDNADQNYAGSTLYEKDAKYLRLKTIQIAYDFHFPFLKALGMTGLQLALSAYNLFTITPYKFGDPEARASTTPSYPLQRTYTASIKLGF